MDSPNSFAVIGLAALIHASFQLSVSVLTLLSGHSISSKHSQTKLLRLTASYIFGVVIMTLLLLSVASLLFQAAFTFEPPQIVWAMACGLMVGIAISVWLFYYRREKGTSLWIPRDFASYLDDRIKSTRASVEAFSLGLISVIGELLFLIAPLVITGLTLIRLPASQQLIGIMIYSVISMLPIAVIWVLINSGHSLSGIQKWREKNKYFLQFTAGLGLVILSYFVYVSEIINVTVGAI